MGTIQGTYGELLGITLGYSDISKHGDEEVSEKSLSYESCDGERDSNHKDGGEELEESALWYLIGSDGGSEIGLSDELFDGFEHGKVEGRSLVELL